jgi:hypothetical protein
MNNLMHVQSMSCIARIGSIALAQMRLAISHDFHMHAKRLPRKEPTLSSCGILQHKSRTRSHQHLPLHHRARVQRSRNRITFSGKEEGAACSPFPHFGPAQQADYKQRTNSLPGKH